MTILTQSCYDHLKIKNADGDTLFDLDSGAEGGSDNPYGVRTSSTPARFGRLPVSLGSVSHSSGIPGGSAATRDYGLRTVGWTTTIEGDSVLEADSAANELVRLIDEGSVNGNRLLYSIDATLPDRYIRWLGAEDLPPLIEDADLTVIRESNIVFLNVTLVAQPLFERDQLLASVNLIGNPTLLLDSDANGRPDGWTLSSATGITSENIDADAEGPFPNWKGAYELTAATSATREWTRDTDAASFAVGEVATLYVWARVISGTSARLRMVARFRTSGGADVGSESAGTQVTLTTEWQRIEVTTAAAGASTDRLKAYIRMANADANVNVIQMTAVQVSKSSSALDFRIGPQAVSSDPNTGSLVALVYNPGSGPARVGTYITGPATDDFGSVYLGLHFKGAEPSAPLHFLNGGSFVQLEGLAADDRGVDTAVATSAGSASGGATNNVLRTTFADAAYDSRWSITSGLTTAIKNALRGKRFRLLVRVIATATLSGEIGQTDETPQSYSITGAASTELIDLGVVTFPEYAESFFVDVSASRTSGSGNLEWDLVAFLPVDESSMYAAGNSDASPDMYVLVPPGLGEGPELFTADEDRVFATDFEEFTGDPGLWVPPGLSAVYVHPMDLPDLNDQAPLIAATVEFDVTPHDLVA